MKKRNIALCILFSIISFGIYGLYWFVKLTNDSNTICPEKKTASGGMALLFSIITGGIYTFYWMYKLGQKLKGSGVLYLVLCFFGMWVGVCVLNISLVPMEVRIGQQIPWNWSYRQV